MRSLFDDFVKAIKSQLPNARISWDISAWIGTEGMRTWLVLRKLIKKLDTIGYYFFLNLLFRWGFFSNSTDIDFINTSGGQVFIHFSFYKIIKIFNSIQ
jgi:hypothetical protein